MERYDYEKAMREDIREYLDENWEKGKRIEDDDRDKLREDMWIADGVTGNGSGSYTFRSFKAEENVCHNLDILGEALDEFCVDGSTLAKKMSGEWADVTIRCMMLGRVADEIFDEWNAKIDENSNNEGDIVCPICGSREVSIEGGDATCEECDYSWEIKDYTKSEDEDGE